MKPACAICESNAALVRDIAAGMRERRHHPDAVAAVKESANAIECACAHMRFPKKVEPRTDAELLDFLDRLPLGARLSRMHSQAGEIFWALSFSGPPQAFDAWPAIRTAIAAKMDGAT